MPFNFDFTVQSSYSVDLQNQQARNIIDMVQTIWIDNSNNDQPVSIQFDVIGQTVKFGPRWQGYFPVMVVNPPRFSVSSPGGSSTQIVLMNVPFPSGAWGTTQQNGVYDASGNLLVSDVALEAAVQGNHFQTDGWVRSNNDVWIPRAYSANNFTGAVVAVGSTAVLAAGGATANIFISSMDISISGNATSAAATVVVSLMNAAAVIFQHEVALPLAAGVGMVKLFNQTDLNYIFSTANTALNINLSAALTAGNIRYNIGAGYTAIVRP